MMFKPITPTEVRDLNERFPDEIIIIFNELIIENFKDGIATFLQQDVINRIMRSPIRDLYKSTWLNVEAYYAKYGWNVSHNKPGFNEIYPAFFTFKEK